MRARKYGRIAIDPEMHRQIAVAAATEGVSMKSLTERLLRLGMVAPEMSTALILVRRLGIKSLLGAYAANRAVHESLAAYDAALNPEGDPNA